MSFPPFFVQEMAKKISRGLFKSEPNEEKVDPIVSKSIDRATSMQDPVSSSFSATEPQQEDPLMEKKQDHPEKSNSASSDSGRIPLPSSLVLVYTPLAFLFMVGICYVLYSLDSSPIL